LFQLTPGFLRDCVFNKLLVEQIRHNFFNITGKSRMPKKFNCLSVPILVDCILESRSSLYSFSKNLVFLRVVFIFHSNYYKKNVLSLNRQCSIWFSPSRRLYVPEAGFAGLGDI
jgi:hypothetical protein